MKIELHKISKRFNYDWIFRDISCTFESGNPVAITGPNGSGKSTLLRILSGQLTQSTGEIEYTHDGKIKTEEIYRYVSYCAPYLSLIEELSLEEIISFHAGFKPFLIPVEEIPAMASLERHRHKQLKFFSSGMKQRVKILLSVLTDAPMLLLDEPTTNLDEAGVSWYLELIEKYSHGKCIVVASNQEREYSFCRNSLSMQNFKPA